MLKKILLALAVIVVAFLAIVATRPSTFHVERAITIQAPPQIVFRIVNDFHRWGEWSPWDHLDPNQKKTYGGPAAGVGATYAWVGNDQVGEGRMTLVESKANEHIGLKLEFIKPFESTNAVAFHLKAEAGGTNVVWSMDGNNNFMAKAASLFMDMDKMIGTDFEKGLLSLKGVAAKDAEAAKRAAEEAAKKAAEEAAAKKAAEEAAAAAAAAAAAPPAPVKKTKH